MKIMYHEYAISNYEFDNFIIRFSVAKFKREEMEVTRYDNVNENIPT
jgi:hypothetical protein